jgi:hypothetical protein
MAKINLDFGTKRALGKYLPSILINSISIDNRDTNTEGIPTATASDYGTASDIIITANLIINITKPKDMQDPAAWIKEYLGDLYLYTYISGFEQLNTELENKNFFLKDLQSAFSVPNRETFNSNTTGFSVIHEYLKEAFIAHEWHSWSGAAGTQIRDAYDEASTSELSAGLSDPSCIWHYLFYGIYGTTGPWWGHAGWDSGAGGDLASTKILYSDIFHTSEITYDFQTNAVGKSFMKKFLDNYIYFLAGTTWPTSGTGFTSDVNLLTRKIALSELLTEADEPSEYGANFFIQNVYDQEGNELIQISNITVSFEYGIQYTTLDSGEDYSAIFQRLLKTDKVFFIGTIGVDTDEVGISDTPRSIYNSYFGNISYEHILDNNEVPTQYVETYHVSNTGAPYDEIPIANLDGRFHVIEPVNHDVITSQVQALIDVHEHRKKDQPSLKRNIETLESIIETYKSSPTILRILAGYQRSYSPQDASKPSGWFYNDFTSLLATLSKRVGYQPRLDLKMTRVGIVTDYRALAINEIYYPPDPYFKADGTTPLFNTDDDTFIPSKWARMARMTMMADVSSLDEFPGFGSDNEEFRQDIWRELYDSGRIDGWLAAGFTMADIESWVEATTSQMTLREGSAWIDGDDASEVIDDMHDPFGLARLEDYDYVVQNSGHFWFDWEKALYTQSKIAQVIPLHKLGRYFRLKVPYKYFPVTECKMIRKELDIRLGLDDDLETWEWRAKSHTMTLKTSLGSGDLPGSERQTIKHEVAPLISDSDWAYGFPVKQVSSLRPISDTSKGIYSNASSRLQGDYVSGDFGSEITSHAAGDHIRLATVEAKSYLKFVMADSAINNVSISTAAHAYTDDTDGYSLGKDTLIGYGYAPPGVPGEEIEGAVGSEEGYSTVPTDSALNLGYKVRNGYRLMAFEYQDLMDDDVAFYNTMSYRTDGFPNRQEALEQANSKGETNSEYKVVISVEDKTLAFYTDVFWPFVSAAYEDFYEYYLFAEEFCSFNNLNNQFNQFFVDAINERYADSSEKRWVRAALVATLLKEILFRSFAHIEPDSEQALRDLLEAEVLKIVGNISPEEGNLNALRQFNCRFGNYLTKLNPHHEFFREFCDESGTGAEVYDRAKEISGISADSFVDGASDWDLLRDVSEPLEFSNHLQIDSVIYGDYLLNAQLESDITFGRLGVHPLEIPPAHLYLTSGAPSDSDGGYSAQNRILVRAHDFSASGPGGADPAPIPGSIIHTGVDTGWYYLDNLVTATSESATTAEEAPGFNQSRSTPILIDLGADSLSTTYQLDPIDESLSAREVFNRANEAGTTTFSRDVYRYIAGATSGATSTTGFGGESPLARFTYVILPASVINDWSATPDTSPGLIGQIFDPTSAGKHLNIGGIRRSSLEAWSSTVSVTDLVMGDESIYLDGELGFPNWGNLDTTTGWLGFDLALTDWRFYKPSFSSPPVDAVDE